MSSSRRRLMLGLALALLTLPRPAAADYVTQTLLLSSPTDPAGKGGSVKVEAYNGVGTAGGSLNAGEVRLTYSRGLGYPDVIEPGIDSYVRGFQGIGFNTDLSLTADQIVGPTGWSASPGALLGTHGEFEWAVATSTNYRDDVSILITGLGADALLSHFLLPSTGSTGGPAYFAGQWLDVALGPNGYDRSEIVASPGTTSGPAPGPGPEPVPGPGPEPVPGPNETPEPGSLALAGLGLIGLAAARLRRRRAAA